MREKGQIYTFLTLKNHIYSNSIKSIIVQWFSTILGKIHAKIEKIILVSFWENGLTNQKCPNFDLQKTTLRAFQPNPPYHMLFMSSQRSFMKKKKKSYWTVFEKTNFKVYPIWSHVNFLTPKKAIYSNFLAHIFS